ncbi:MAG TPA: MmcQ/YjbR family DNA-binding protein [Pseudonocardiaceae bacterium]|jgi:hypothetical protein|nr:MmcQ/YjbR family DNA-binding protein [Pseudonocardiaceae bacterium]
MATWADVSRIALALPQTSEGTSWGNRSWKVKDKSFAFERPLRTTDLAALGADAPDGPILGVRTADEGVKQVLIADDPAVYFTVPHFDGYAAILVLLDRVALDELTELLTDAWLLRAPKTLARDYLGKA